MLKPNPKLGGCSHPLIRNPILARRSADGLHDVTDALTFCGGSTLATLPPETQPHCHCCLPLLIPRWVKPSHSSGPPRCSASGQQLAPETLSVHKPDNLYTGLLWMTWGGGGWWLTLVALALLQALTSVRATQLGTLVFLVFSCV